MHAHWLLRLPCLALLLPLAAWMGCAGAIEGEGGTGSGSGEPGGGTAGGGSRAGEDGAGKGGPTPPGNAGGAGGPAAACSSEPGAAPLRRLSRSEYGFTVRDLFPGLGAARFTFAPDAESEGFENRAKLLNPTPLLVEQYNAAATAIAEKAVADLAAILPCMPTAATEAACGAQFVEVFGARAFRRPLADSEKRTFTDIFNRHRTGISFKAGIQLTIEAFLQAPPFLYRVELGDPAAINGGRVRLAAYEMATRLSYLLWGSMPDQGLFDAARANKLATAADIDATARRMLKDKKTAEAFVDFHRQWLDLDRLDRETKDAKLFPSYTPALAAAMKEESNRLVDGVMASGDGTLKSLLTSNATSVDTGLAKLYGVAAPASGWMPATLNPVERAGFLTRANFLASHAHGLSGSPPLRAVFIMRRLLCAPPPPPPNDADTSPPKPKTGEGLMTNRQLFERRTVGACQGCHNIIDPIGFGLENYDAIGQYRTMDNGFPVNSAGELKMGDVTGTFQGGVELSKKLGESGQVRFCAATQWYQYAFGRDKDDADDCRIKELDQALARTGGDIREMLVSLAKTNEFMYRPVIRP